MSNFEREGYPMSTNSKKKQSVQCSSDKTKNTDNTIRFIVPMPGKSPWKVSKNQLSYKKFHKFNNLTGDYALEDFQAQFLMQREYFID